MLFSETLFAGGKLVFVKDGNESTELPEEFASETPNPETDD